MYCLEAIKKQNALTATDILNFCKKMSKSQGFYGHLYQSLMAYPEALRELERKQFSDYADFVLFIES